MKILFTIIAMVVGISCFAEAYNKDKSNELYGVFQKTRKLEDKMAWQNYALNSEYSKDIPEAWNRDKAVMVVIIKYSGLDTKEKILEAIDKEYKISDEKLRFNAMINVARHNHAYEVLINEFDNLTLRMKESNAPFIANYFLQNKDYDKAIEWASKVDISPQTASVLMRAYGAKGDFEKAFNAGERLFLDTYVTSPKVAMNVITNMLNRVPESYDDARLANFLSKIGKKYPAPGSDFEEWKSFMGFIGYRYKSLTGKDLFVNGSK